MSWGPEVYGRDAVLGALNRLFLALAVEEQQRQGEGPLLAAAMPRHGLASASELRRALAALPGLQQFCAGECCGLLPACVVGACAGHGRWHVLHTPPADGSWLSWAHPPTHPPTTTSQTSRRRGPGARRRAAGTV